MTSHSAWGASGATVSVASHMKGLKPAPATAPSAMPDEVSRDGTVLDLHALDLSTLQMAHFEQLLMRRLDEIIEECENLDQMVQKLEAEVEKAAALGRKTA